MRWLIVLCALVSAACATKGPSPEQIILDGHVAALNDCALLNPGDQFAVEREQCRQDATARAMLMMQALQAGNAREAGRRAAAAAYLGAIQRNQPTPSPQPSAPTFTYCRGNPSTNSAYCF